MDVTDLLKTATTDSLSRLLADVLTTLRTRGAVTLTDGRVDTEHATITLDGDGVTFIPIYYSEANAETAMEQRDPPLCTLEEAAEKLGMTAPQLAAFIEAEKAHMIADGHAHYDGDHLVIDGGA